MCFLGLGPNRVLVFELGTGKKVGEVNSLFELSGAMSFSPNSEYLSVTSVYGGISIWGPDESVGENIK